MRPLWAVSLMSIFLAAALCQAPPGVPPGSVNLSADSLLRDGAITHGRGHVRVTFGGLVYQADEAALHSDTGELDLRGRVQVIFPARADHHIFRFGSSDATADPRGIAVPTGSGKPTALVTTEAVRLSAGQMTVKGGMLQASGNILVRTSDSEVRSDELTMALRTADATLNGHIQTSGRAAHEGQAPEMPPEIVK